MEHIDNFLKKLKTDRNTFLTYILTLISFYLCIDRIVEIIFIASTGMYVDLWGPIKYTLAIFCVTFAFHFSGSSKFVTEDNVKLSFLYIHVIGLYILAISMIIQWANALAWLFFFSVPNYSDIIINFRELIRPAFSAFAWYLPIVTFYPVFNTLYVNWHDTKDIRDSIFDYGGIDLSDKTKGWGPYTCEMFLCKDGETGKSIKIPESRRFESTLVVGVSGSGKTSMIFEPMVARDLEKKYFFKESAKELGYTALRTGLANLNSPYSNEYINENFNLNMLTPNEGKEKLYKAYMSKLIIAQDKDNYIYKNLGLTYIAPDAETINTMSEVAKNFGIKYHIVDPTDPNSSGINPFIFKDPVKTSIAISSVLKVMFKEETEIAYASTDTFLQNVAAQAIENLTLLLYEMYPLEHDDEIPTLEDLLKLLYNFEEIERLAEKMKTIPELAEKYSIQLQYYKANFYKDSPNNAENQKQIQTLTAQLANLIRYPGIKNVICNKTNNINYDNALKNGEIIFVCTRRGDLGPSIHKAFGTFFILLMQHSVLSRPEKSERDRVPHFLYIDEFPPFLSKATSSIFTLYRKYRVGTIISAQNLSQFGTQTGSNYRQTLLANCTTKIVFGNNTPEDNEWWQEELGEKREWQFKNNYETEGKAVKVENTDGKRKIGEKYEYQSPHYESKYSDIKWGWTKNYKAGKIQSLKFKQILYKTKDLKGKNIVGKAKVDFLEGRYKDEQKVKSFNYTKFIKGISNPEKSSKFNLRGLKFDEEEDLNSGETNPIKNNIFNSNYKFDDENAITNYSIKRKNNDNN